MNIQIKNIGLDVHKKSIPIGIADDGRDGEVRCKKDNDMNQLDKVIQKLICSRSSAQLCRSESLT